MPRQLENLIRLTLAHARILLKQEATAEDEVERILNFLSRSGKVLFPRKGFGPGV